MTREEAYDEKVAPLMTQIIAICKEHDIPMLASFQLDDDRSAPDLCCTTVILPKDAAPKLLAACEIIYPRHPVFAITITHGPRQ